MRTDLPHPHYLSVSNTQNFGNEPNAFHLLAPCSTADRGVNETHYLQRLGREQVQTLLKAANISMQEGEFEACFVASAQAEGQSEQTSLKSFMDVRHFMLHKLAGL